MTALPLKTQMSHKNRVSRPAPDGNQTGLSGATGAGDRLGDGRVEALMVRDVRRAV